MEEGEPESVIRIFGKKQTLEELEHPPVYRVHQKSGEEWRVNIKGAQNKEKTKASIYYSLCNPIPEL